MTLDEAINKLEDLKRYAYEPQTQLAYNSLQLGIEALKREKFVRKHLKSSSIELLPGETED